MKRMFQFLFLLLLGLSSTTLYAAENTVHEYQLKNGLKLIVKEDHRAPVVISQVWYKVGSSYEHGGITGISHALEHMMFRGSKNYSAAEFLNTIAENGGEQNAFTATDYTAYYETLSADKLPISFKLEADRMRYALLRPEDFAKEIQIVMEERRMRTEDDPQQLTSERMMAAAHLSSPYHNPPIGWMNDLQHMTADDLKQWYQTWYAPNNAIVVVVGDVNPQKVYELAQQYFGDLKPSNIPAIKPQKEVKSLGMRTVEVATPAKLPWLLMVYNVPVLNTAQEKWQPYALYVLAGILDAGNSARLPKNLVRGKQLVTDVDVDYTPFDRIDTLFGLAGTPAPGRTIPEVQQALLQEIHHLQTTLVTPEELERVKAQVIANRVFQRDSLDYQAYEIGSLESVGLSWREADNAIKQIQAITPEQIQTVARTYLVPENLTVAVLKPLPLSKKDEAKLQQPPSKELR